MYTQVNKTWLGVWASWKGDEARATHHRHLIKTTTTTTNKENVRMLGHAVGKLGTIIIELTPAVHGGGFTLWQTLKRKRNQHPRSRRLSTSRRQRRKVLLLHPHLLLHLRRLRLLLLRPPQLRVNRRSMWEEVDSFPSTRFVSIIFLWAPGERGSYPKVVSPGGHTARQCSRVRLGLRLRWIGRCMHNVNISPINVQDFAKSCNNSIWINPIRLKIC